MQHGRGLTPAECHGLDGKEGVDGSSPSEGSAKAPHVGAFAFTSTCRFSRVRWVWSRLWSFRVGEGADRARPMPSDAPPGQKRRPERAVSLANERVGRNDGCSA